MRGPIIDLAKQPLAFEPGSSWVYGPGYELVGLMVARSNLTSLDSYMREHIFVVLGMDETSFHPLAHGDMAQRLMPMSTRVSPDEPLIDGEAPDVVVGALPLDPDDEYGGGGFFSTVEDYLKLLKSLLHNDGKLLKSESIDLLFKDALSPPTKAGLDMMLSNELWASICIPGEPPVGTAHSSN
jgi:CubicO group peptidase (beta-lactamase class C family)